MLLLLLACASRAPVPEALEGAPASVTVVPGPWEGSRAIALVSTGPRDLGGRWTGPAIVVAAWVDPGGALHLSSSFDGGHGWSSPVRVAEGVEVDGPVRPQLALTRGGPTLAFAADGVPQLARRGDEGWRVAPVEEGARGRLIALAAHGGEPVVAWVDARGEAPTLRAQVREVTEEIAASGLCAASPPALGVVDDLPAVVFREVDEQGVVTARLLTRTLFEWEDRGLVSAGSWVPEACPRDPPSFDGADVLLSDGRGGALGVYVGERQLPSTEGWDAWQPQRAAGSFVRIERSPERSRLVADAFPIIGSEGELWLGDTAELPGELLISWDQGDRGFVAAFAPAEVF